MKVLLVCSFILGLSVAYDIGVYESQVNKTCSCGWRNTPRIVGGKETKRNEYPWMVAVEKTSNGYQYCGGSVITSRHVLTAAHCTSNKTPDNICIEVGRHNLVKWKEANGVKYFIKRIINHPAYNRSTVINDISILETTKDIAFNQFVGPVCLPNRQIALEHQFVKVLGWGLTSYWGYESDTLREVDLQVIPLSECAKSWKNLQTDGKQLCAYTEKKDSCGGDSGGPLVWLDPENNKFTQIALVSYGDDYCGRSLPSVNTDLTAYMDWINSEITASNLGVEVCTKSTELPA